MSSLFLYVSLCLLSCSYISASDPALYHQHRTHHYINKAQLSTSTLTTTTTTTTTTSHIEHVMQTTARSTSKIAGYNNKTGASLYYPAETTLLYDIRDPYITDFYDLVETSWNSGSMLFLQHTATETNPQNGAVRLYIGYPDHTRRQILEEYWSNLTHPWYLGRDLAYLSTADPDKVFVTFEGVVNRFNVYYMSLAFYSLNLSNPMIEPHYVNESMTTWVTRFKLPANSTEVLYNSVGDVINAAWVMPPNQQNIMSQFTGVTSYVITALAGTASSPDNGFLLLVRTMQVNAVRLMKYNSTLGVQWNTVLVPTIQGAGTSPPPTGSQVGFVEADPDGHIYVLVDIFPYQRTSVIKHLGTKLKTEPGVTKPSILYLVERETGNIIRADWVPFNLTVPFDLAVASGLSVQKGDGDVALIFNGIKYPSRDLGAIINFVDYDIQYETYEPKANSATLNTYPTDVYDVCRPISTQMQTNAVARLKDGRYVVAGSHGFGLASDGSSYTASTGFVAIFDLLELRDNKLTSKLVWNVGVVGRDNAITHLATSPTTNSLTFGMTLDGSTSESNDNYYHSAVFKTNDGFQNEYCDAVTKVSNTMLGQWTLTCSTETCVSWCTTMVQNAQQDLFPNHTLSSTETCATIPTSPPTTKPPTPLPTQAPTPSQGGPTSSFPTNTIAPTATPTGNPVTSSSSSSTGGNAGTSSSSSSPFASSSSLSSLPSPSLSSSSSTFPSSSSSVSPSSSSSSSGAAAIDGNNNNNNDGSSSQTTSSSNTNRATALGVGLGIGLVGGLCLLILLVILCVRRKRQRNTSAAGDEGVVMGNGVRHQVLENEV